MENKKRPSHKKKLSNQEEKAIRHENYVSTTVSPARVLQKRDLALLQNNSANQEPPQRVVHVTLSPRRPSIKTIFLAEKSRFIATEESVKSRSVLAIGDHPSLNNYFAESHLSSNLDGKRFLENREDISDQGFKTNFSVDWRQEGSNVYQTEFKQPEKCHMPANRGTLLRNPHKHFQAFKKTTDIARNIFHFIDSEDNKGTPVSISQLNNKINALKRVAERQEMVLDDLNSLHSLSSSDEEYRENMKRDSSESTRPGCSYIEHYSHIPETSAFQRYAQQSSQMSPNKGATIEKEHNSEQYGRDFTAYDGLTARGRRQCNSATCKREDVPLHTATDRITKIRHKLNPVRDYRLMDTVHYLAQGEFAPRNDGIKLTPSREAVLSDIIWEDVCRTHWPSARLGRRNTQQERVTTRGELQRLIDSLLRERVAHVERRRRRHYRVVKHTQHSAGRVGKTGDIIVASHKNKHRDESDLRIGHTHHASGLMQSSRRWPEYHRTHRSDDCLESPDRRRLVEAECTPGPSYAAPRRREPTCCYHAAGPSRPRDRPQHKYTKEIACLSSNSTASSEKQRHSPRLIVRKESRRKTHQKEDLNLEHFILLPTLVVRTPSNVKRQKKFNELYHRILNQLSSDRNSVTRNEQSEPRSYRSLKQDSDISVDRGKHK